MPVSALVGRTGLMQKCLVLQAKILYTALVRDCTALRNINPMKTGL